MDNHTVEVIYLPAITVTIHIPGKDNQQVILASQDGTYTYYCEYETTAAGVKDFKSYVCAVTVLKAGQSQPQSLYQNSYNYNYNSSENNFYSNQPLAKEVAGNAKYTAYKSYALDLGAFGGQAASVDIYCRAIYSISIQMVDLLNLIVPAQRIMKVATDPAVDGVYGISATFKLFLKDITFDNKIPGTGNTSSIWVIDSLQINGVDHEVPSGPTELTVSGDTTVYAYQHDRTFNPGSSGGLTVKYVQVSITAGSGVSSIAYAVGTGANRTYWVVKAPSFAMAANSTVYLQARASDGSALENVVWSDGSTENPHKLTLATEAVTISAYAGSGASGRFVVHWQNADGSELCSTEVKAGEVPVYSGTVPTRASDASNDYTFSGWSPTVADVVSDTVYTAVYQAAPRISDYVLTLPASQPGLYTVAALGATTVQTGGTFSFAVKPAVGATQSAPVVRANGAVLTPADGVYTIANVNADQVITVTGTSVNVYAVLGYMAHGTVTNGNQAINYGGASSPMIFEADDGYHISYYLINDVIFLVPKGVGSLLFNSVEEVHEDIAVEVITEKDPAPLAAQTAAVTGPTYSSADSPGTWVPLNGIGRRVYDDSGAVARRAGRLPAAAAEPVAPTD